MIKDQDTLHCFTLSEVGIIIGKPIVDEHKRIIGIKNARLTQLNAEKRTVAFAPMFGNKEEMYLGNIKFMFCELIDKKIIELYKQHMSGIVVTNQMPAVPPTGPKLVKP